LLTGSAFLSTGDIEKFLVATLYYDETRAILPYGVTTIGYIYLDWALAERCGLPPGSLVAETCGAIEENVLGALEDLNFDITKPS
jgi:hypothetical protein